MIRSDGSRIEQQGHWPVLSSTMAGAQLECGGRPIALSLLHPTKPPQSLLCAHTPTHLFHLPIDHAGEHGDLHVILRTQPHPSFERRGDGLMHNATISLLEALVGFEREVGGWRGVPTYESAAKRMDMPCKFP